MQKENDPNWKRPEILSLTVERLYKLGFRRAEVIKSSRFSITNRLNLMLGELFINRSIDSITDILMEGRDIIAHDFAEYLNGKYNPPSLFKDLKEGTRPTSSSIITRAEDLKSTYFATIAPMVALNTLSLEISKDLNSSDELLLRERSISLLLKQYYKRNLSKRILYQESKGLSISLH